METLRGKLTPHGSKGGGDGRKGDRGGATPPRKLERKFATKNINYEHNNRRRSGSKYDESSFGDSDSNHSREDPYVFHDYRVLGKASVESMKEVCEFLGLPAPQSLGITREDWDASKLPTHSSVLSTESVSSAQEDSSDFTFDVSPPPSHLPPSVRKVFRDANRDFNDSGVGEETVNYAVSSPSARDADASAGGSLGGNNRAEGQDRILEIKSNRHVWVARSSSMPAFQKLSFSPPGSLYTTGTPRPLQDENRMLHPDPRTHILRAQSQPTHMSSEFSIPAYETGGIGEDTVLESNNVPLKKSESVGSDRVTADETVSNLASVHREEPVPRVREVDASSRSSSYSDSSGEFSSNYSPRDPSRSPDQRRFNKKQDVADVKAGTPTKQGLLNRPPPMSLTSVSPDAFSSHDLLNGLGPDDVSVRRPESDSDDDAHERHATAEQEEEPYTDVDSPEVIHDRPMEPVVEVVSPSPVQIALVPEGKKATDAVDSANERVDEVEVRLSETESGGEVISSAEMQTQRLEEGIMAINLTESPVHVDQVQHPNSSESDNTQTVAFPWTKGELLGAGSFGTVFEAVDSHGRFFAVKEVSLVDTDKNAQQCVTQLEQEINLLSGFKHENIVQYLGTERADGKLYIFLELVSKGSLASLSKKIRLTHSHIMAYTRQILRGLKYLHDMNIVHRDIKCANILVDVRGTCKLADFGLAKQISALDQLKSCKGSAYWMAPEVIDPKKTYWLAADIWSLGCSVLEMFTGSPPFGDQEWYRVLWKVGHGEAPPIPEDLSEDAQDFLRQCLQINPSDRPSATVLLQHRFLSGSVTPTSSGHLNPQLAVGSLQTITEERSGDFATTATGTYRASPGDSPLPNGHS
ncbi:hypothetical protein R1sor_008202 [Riccia sorocarpa]|uniref:mitogen-activated protein kinase kinase kinase n=1 Tax=Riccia sorocarpa TaxID=122646 RepID=A0ABD3HUV8_9MARC